MSPPDDKPAGRPTVVLAGGTARNRTALLAAILGEPDWSWGTAPPMFGEVRHAVRASGPADDECGAHRVVAGHPASILEHITVVDTPGLDGQLPGAQALEAELEPAAAVLFLIDALPLSEPEFDLLRICRRHSDRAVLCVAGPERPRSRAELSRRIAHEPADPFVARDDLPGLHAALRTVADGARLHRDVAALYTVRSAGIQLDLLTRDRIAAVHRADTHLALIGERITAADGRPAAIAARPPTVTPVVAPVADRMISAVSRWFATATATDTDSGLEPARPGRIDLALADIAAQVSRLLAYRAGATVHDTVGELFSRDETRTVERWVRDRTEELIQLAEAHREEGPLVVVEPLAPRPPWGNGGSRIGVWPPLLLGGFDLRLAVDARDTQPSREWQERVLDAARAAVAAEIARRGALVDAALDRALAEANARWKQRLLDQLTESDAIGDDPGARDRVAEALADESAAVRIWLRRLDKINLATRGWPIEGLE